MGAQPEAIRWTGVLRGRREGSLTARAERAAVRGALRGDPAALDVLFRAHWPAAYRTAWLILRYPHTRGDMGPEGLVARGGRWSASTTSDPSVRGCARSWRGGRSTWRAPGRRGARSTAPKSSSRWR